MPAPIHPEITQKDFAVTEYESNSTRLQANSLLTA